MRLQQYLIGITPKKKQKNQDQPKDVDKLLERLNKQLKRYKIKDYEFSLLPKEEFTSPSEVLKNIDKRKTDIITKEWMEINEKLEEMKDWLTNQ